MPLPLVGLIMVSVLLTAFSQIILKFGMSRPVLQAAMASSGQPMASIIGLVTSPYVVIGMMSFGLSALVWLLVLSKINVSTAYPFVSLGIVITAIAARVLLGEQIDTLKAAGMALIVVGVITVAAAG